MFTKKILLTNKILSDVNIKQGGKRGFRVYPTWSIPNNKQALATQTWQIEYFSKDIAF